jgi:outer membrane protein
MHRSTQPTPRANRTLLVTCSVPLLLIWSAKSGLAQCAGTATTPEFAADCAAHGIPVDKIASLDSSRHYTLAELVDIAEHNNPRTRVAWERAKQRADQLGVERSAYYPVLAALASFSDQRVLEPFPKPLSPVGYSLFELPVLQPEVTVEYTIFDFGRRGARVDAATAEKLAAGANFIQVNQDVAFRVSVSYYNLLTAQERLQAALDTLKTAQTTQDASEAQLSNGRATLPDVLNARAETAQSRFDLESADGDEKIARVTLTEAIGVEPSPNIAIDGEENAPRPEALTLSIDALIDRAMAGRPDLMAQALEIRAADAEIRAARAEYRPKVVVSASAANTTLWPQSPGGVLGSTSQFTWSTELAMEWSIFDGGRRKNNVAAAQSRFRQAQDELTDKRDQAARQVWTAYIAFRSAVRKEQAAAALLQAASTSYSASLDAYQYGVKNLIDVVTAEKQLAQARLSSVSARSQLFLEAVDLEFVTGNLLRNLPKATKTETLGGGK